MRRELKKRGISSLKVVYSKEEPVPREEKSRTPRCIPAPANTRKRGVRPTGRRVILAGEVIKDLTDGLLPEPPNGRLIHKFLGIGNLSAR